MCKYSHTCKYSFKCKCKCKYKQKYKYSFRCKWRDEDAVWGCQLIKQQGE